MDSMIAHRGPGRPTVVSTRVTRIERAHLEDLADVRGLTLSDLLRAMIRRELTVGQGPER